MPKAPAHGPTPFEIGPDGFSSRPPRTSTDWAMLLRKAGKAGAELADRITAPAPSTPDPNPWRDALRARHRALETRRERRQAVLRMAAAHGFERAAVPDDHLAGRRPSMAGRVPTR